LTIFPTFLQFLLLKNNFFSSNLKKRALSWFLRNILSKNNLVSPKTTVKSRDKAHFLRLELNIGRVKA
jgi:poly(3-hydroxyalkanoate) synthetase